MSDLRHALRTIWRAPRLSATVILTVALAIGVNTAIFSVVNAVTLRPLPFQQPERLVQVGEKNDALNLPNFASSMLNFLSWKEQLPSLRSAGANLKALLMLAGRGSATPAAPRLRNTLAAAELALATLLLIGAGLMIQTLSELQRVPLGFEPRGILAFQVAPPTARYP